MRDWIRSWWVTLRHGSPLTRSGRALRATMRDMDDPRHWAEVPRPEAP